MSPFRSPNSSKDTTLTARKLESRDYETKSVDIRVNGFLTDTNTAEIKEHVCREKLARPSGSDVDVKLNVRTLYPAKGKLEFAVRGKRVAKDI